MIKISVYTANTDIDHHHGTFTKGEKYFGRYSLSGDMFLIMSNEGNWIPFVVRYFAKSGLNSFLKNFKKEKECLYIRNKKDINKIGSAKEWENLNDFANVYSRCEKCHYSKAFCNCEGEDKFDKENDIISNS
ncbi:hypothetical protein FKN04_22830 [Bacillus glycinifermentans]|uniref:hypothetical protein n=1 Tax=Bacillus TaxID=1386 RepID=UPI0015820A11|nr:MULTISPECIES: hypothetical protein [Bacillus]NUJ19370.1 hypothetical protein [Bacillus glycinifermentans]GIN67106.1 hypothetical protein J41TS2_25270 [Bacillus sonorensis]